MLSSRAKYAVRAVTYLARQKDPARWAATIDVAEQETIPRKFLEAIFVALRDADLVRSRRGAHGGHRLARPAAEISVADVIRVIDGPLALTPCASVTRFGRCTDCVDVEGCGLQSLMRAARDAVADVLEGCSLAQLARDPASVMTALSGAGQPAQE